MMPKLTRLWLLTSLLLSLAAVASAVTPHRVGCLAIVDPPAVTCSAQGLLVDTGTVLVVACVGAYVSPTTFDQNTTFPGVTVRTFEGTTATDVTNCAMLVSPAGGWSGSRPTTSKCCSKARTRSAGAWSRSTSAKPAVIARTGGWSAGRTRENAAGVEAARAHARHHRRERAL